MINSPQTATNLVDVIRYWAQQRPDQEVLRYYPQGEGDYTCLTYQQLHQRCEAIASHLAPYKDQRALLLFNSSLDFLEALFACFYAGVVAVPAYPPRKNHHLQRLAALVEDCQPNVILSAANIIDSAKPLFEQATDAALQHLPWMNSDAIDTADHQHYQAFSPDAEQLAFLQYTSGSTGKPKGVMISHKNLMTNIRMAEKAFGLTPDARCVSWLPLFHDMGLIGCVMTPLYWGAGSVLMPPAAFLQKPLRWLKLLDQFGQQSPVGCTAPNFSYQLCVDHVSDDDAARLNLSNWVFALSGAEPIRAATLEAFAAKFAVSGFQKQALVPAYGMAECTVLSTCRQHKPITTRNVASHVLAENRIDESPDGNLLLVSSGSTCAPQTLCIADPETGVVQADGQVGEIWLAGDHIAKGYWNQPQLSQQTFQAFTADGRGPFLRTGDLGSVVDGELFVTGRIKDLLIIRGRNHYPQDIELTAMHAADGLQADHTAAFTIEDQGEEKLVIVQEVQRSHQRQFDSETAARALRNAIAREHGVDTFAIAFIRFASIAKTSSGKIQRHACKAGFLAGNLNLIGQWQASGTASRQLPLRPATALADMTSDALEQWIIQWLAAKTGSPASDIPVDAALDGLGMDSVDLVQLTGELESWLGSAMDHTLVWQQPHIRALAATLITLAQQTPQANENDSEEMEGFI